MEILPPLERLFDAAREDAKVLALPPELAHLYGQLSIPLQPDRPCVIGNFVTTLDGVVSLSKRGSGGGDISGYNRQDQAIMGLLRAVADAVIVGAGTLRDAPRHRWTAQFIFPHLADAYQQLRTSLGKSTPPLNVIVSAHGNLDPALPIFQTGEVPVLIVTTARGAAALQRASFSHTVQMVVLDGAETLGARAILRAVRQVRSCEIILVEGGPQLMGDFFGEHCLDEQFLTLAPQIAGRDDSSPRPGLVSGRRFAPEHPLWGSLVSVKRGESHLFLRYAFATVAF